MTTLSYQCGDRVFSISLPDHAKSHEWQSGQPGTDLVNVHPRMFSLLRSTIIPDSILVNVSPYYYLDGGSFKTFGGGVYNLTPHIPLTPNYVRLVLLGLDTSTNQLAAYSGDEEFNSALTPPTPPINIPTSFIPSALVRVKYGGVALTELDVTDARVFLSAQSGGGWPFTEVRTVSTTNPLADHSLIQDAVNAAGSTDCVLLDAQVFTETVVINKYMTFRGHDLATSVINGKITSSVGAVISNVTGSVTSGEALEISATAGTIKDSRWIAYGSGVDLKAIYNRHSGNLHNVRAEAGGGGGNQYALYCSPTISRTTTVWGGHYNGATADIYADTNAVIVLEGPVLEHASNTVYPIAGPGTVKGHYYDTSGNLYFARGQSGLQGKVWRHTANGFRVPEADLPTAIANCSAGDKVKLFAGTYTLTSTLSLNNAIEVEGDGWNTIITSNVSNSPTIDVTDNNVTLRNLTINHTGGGTLAGPLASNNTGLVLDTVQLLKTAGGAGTAYGVWMYGGSLTTKGNTIITISDGTTRYGILNDSAPATITLNAGFEATASTYRIYGTDAGSSLVFNAVLNAVTGVDWAGSITYNAEGNTLAVAYSPTNYIASANTLYDHLYGIDSALGGIVGELRMWATNTAPTKWLLCYGQAVSRTTYAALFSVIGTTFGAGNGSTTFNLPDFRGRMPLGQDDMGGSSANRVTASVADSIGGSGGEETHTLTESEIPAHTHTLNVGAAALTGATANGPRISGGTLTSGYIGNTGGGGAHNNMPPYLTINFIIYAAA